MKFKKYFLVLPIIFFSFLFKTNWFKRLILNLYTSQSNYCIFKFIHDIINADINIIVIFLFFVLGFVFIKKYKKYLLVSFLIVISLVSIPSAINLINSCSNSCYFDLYTLKEDIFDIPLPEPSSEIYKKYELIFSQDMARIELIFAFINFILILAFLFANFKEIKFNFKNINKKTWFFLFLIILFGFVLRISFPYCIDFNGNSTYVLQGDELTYMNQAKNILNKGASRLYTSDNKPYTYVQIGYPFLIAISYKIFGLKKLGPANVSLFFSVLSILLIFLVSYLIFKSKRISLFSSFIFSFLPLNIFYSTSMLSESSSVFFILLALLSFLVYIKNKKTKTLALSILAFAFSLCIRKENLVLIIPILILLLINKIKIKSKKFIFPFFLLVLIIPNILTIYSIPWLYSLLGFEGIQFDISNIIYNIKYAFLLIAGLHPIIFSFFLCFGIYSLRKNKNMFFLLTWLLIFLIIYILYSVPKSSIYSQYPAVWTRFLIQCYPAFCIIAGYGIYNFIKTIKNIT